MLKFSVGVNLLLKCKPVLSSFTTSNRTGRVVLFPLLQDDIWKMQKVTQNKRKICRLVISMQAITDFFFIHTTNLICHLPGIRQDRGHFAQSGYTVHFYLQFL